METITKNELALVIEQSGIEKSKGEVILNSLSGFFKKADGWKDTIDALVIESVEDKGKMKMAREGRLELRRMRLNANKLVQGKRDEVKVKMADYVLEDKLWLKSGQIVDAVFGNLETILKGKEDFAIRIENERLDNLVDKRTKELLPYNEYCVIDTLRLRTMTDQEFESDKAKYKKLFDLDAAEKKRIEDERIAAEKAEKERQEAIRLENEKLKKEAQEKERLAKIEADKRDKAEKERLAKEEAERKEREALAAKAKKEQEEKEDKLRAEADARLKKERDAKAKLEAELKAKREAEEAERKRLDAEAKAKEEADRKASLAPQKEKITAWVNSFMIPTLCSKGFDKEATKKSNDIFEKFGDFKKWAIKEVESIK